MRSFPVVLRGGTRRRIAVHVGAGALARLEEDLVASSGASTITVVSDSNVAPLWGRPLAERLRARGANAHLIEFPAGEASKSRVTKAALEDRLFEIGAGRDTAVVAVGGGVTGDLAGFLAATWHRGVPVFQAPTSLLAMADAALGGKTAVDLPGGKNLVGAFHQPAALYADIATLGSLPDGEFTNGLAEVVKTATIADAGLFRRIERDAGRLVRRLPGAVESAVHACLRIKGRVVSADEREAGARMMLNFGHTVAHAIETTTGYGVPHGRAVAIGLVVEAKLAVRATGFPPEDAARLERLLETLGLPTRLPAGMSPDVLLPVMHRDKKARAGRARFALPAAIGKFADPDAPAVEVDAGLLAETLRGSY